jgi:kynureninase
MTPPAVNEPLTELRALDLDATCPLAGFRDRFLIPPHGDGDQVYFCGNSLGLQPRATRAELLAELDAWAELGVEGHFSGEHPWMHAHTFVREHLAELVGALPSEVVAMNSLTVNLHLMMASFYRPTPERHAILMEKHAFPSDRHAAESQIRFHGYDPATALIELPGDEPNGTLSLEAIAQALAEHGQRIALVLWPGVQYLTGQAFDLGAIVRLSHAQGCLVGLDLAHAAGNLHLRLHEDGPDFAVWCSYKYLNAGAGAVAGCFVHERHAATDRPRLAGWWGHRAETRFQMRPEFIPTPGADGWQLSNPPVLALAPLRASLGLFHEAGMARLRAKSEALTGTLAREIETRLGDVLEILTPAEPARRGCQLSLRVRGGRERGRSLFEHLAREGIVCDWREPDVIRAAPVPLYNRYMDLLRFLLAVEGWGR